MLHRRGLKFFADFGEKRFAFFALDVEDTDLDEFVRGEATVYFFQHRFSQAFLADGHDGGKVMGAGAQGAAFAGSQGNHMGIVTS